MQILPIPLGIKDNAFSLSVNRLYSACSQLVVSYEGEAEVALSLVVSYEGEAKVALSE